MCLGNDPVGPERCFCLRKSEFIVYTIIWLIVNIALPVLLCHVWKTKANKQINLNQRNTESMSIDTYM